MALSFDLEKVSFFKDNPDQLWIEYEMNGGKHSDVNPETKSIIFGCMLTSINSITENTAPDYYGRWKVLEMLDDIYVSSSQTSEGIKKNYITPLIVNKHIGLRTNVSNVTLVRWSSNIVRNSVNCKYSAAEIRSIAQFHAIEYRDFMESIK